jgi:hypothetical protein
MERPIRVQYSDPPSSCHRCGKKNTRESDTNCNIKGVLWQLTNRLSGEARKIIRRQLHTIVKNPTILAVREPHGLVSAHGDFVDDFTGCFVHTHNLRITNSGQRIFK